MEAGPCSDPEPHLGMFVGGVVVDDQMDIELCRDGFIDTLQEAEKFLMPVAWLALGQHHAGVDVERGK